LFDKRDILDLLNAHCQQHWETFICFFGKHAYSQSTKLRGMISMHFLWSPFTVSIH